MHICHLCLAPLREGVETALVKGVDDSFSDTPDYRPRMGRQNVQRRLEKCTIVKACYSRKHTSRVELLEEYHCILYPCHGLGPLVSCGRGNPERDIALGEVVGVVFCGHSVRRCVDEGDTNCSCRGGSRVGKHAYECPL